MRINFAEIDFSFSQLHEFLCTNKNGSQNHLIEWLEIQLQK